MDAALKKIFKREGGGGGDQGPIVTLSEARKPLLVPCFDLLTGAPFVFSRADAKESRSFDFEMWKVCRATMANPGRFKPFLLTSVDGRTVCDAVDGGVVMNNPASAAVTHVLNNRRDFPLVRGVEDLMVLSIGNGRPFPPEKLHCRRRGRCSAAAIVDMAAEGGSETVDQILGNAFRWNRMDYVRVQGDGEVLKEKGVEGLPFGGKRVLEQTNGERIREFARRIVAAAAAANFGEEEEQVEG